MTPRPADRAGRFAVGAAAFRLLADRAAARRTIPYGDFADALALGAPRGLGWLLGPMLGWCREAELPLLPSLVVRRADGLPSGPYAGVDLLAERERVFAQDWARVAPPSADDLVRHAWPASRAVPRR